MEIRIADQVAADLAGRSLKTVRECTSDNPLGQPGWKSENGPSIRAVIHGEKIYASYEETPYARAQLEVLKFMVGATYDIALSVPKAVFPLKVPVSILEPFVDIVISLQERKDALDRSLGDINNEQMQQTLIRNAGNREMFDRSLREMRDASMQSPPIDDSETSP